MGRRRRAWLSNGTGKIAQKGRNLPGFYAEWCDYAGGRRTHRSKHFLKLKQAREFVARFNALRDLQAIGQIPEITIPEAAEEFGRGLSAIAPQTKLDYSGAIGRLAASIGTMDTKLLDITGTHVDAFIAKRMEDTSKATVAKDLRLLGRFFRWCIDRGYLAEDPLRQATTRPKGKFKRARPVVTDDQLRKIAEALDTEDRRLAFWLALTTGLDRTVIQGLTVEQIDMAQGVIVVQRPKTEKPLCVPIHASLRPMLAERIAASRPRTAVLTGLARQDWHPTDASRQEDWWHRACRKAGCPDFWFRDLRALASARAQRLGGLSLADARELLGHASIQTTADHYLPPDPSIRKAIDKLPLPGFPQT